MREAGDTLDAIGARFGLTRERCRQLLTGAGVERGEPPLPRHWPSHDTLRAYLDAHPECVSVRAVKRGIGCRIDNGTMQYLLREHGLWDRLKANRLAHREALKTRMLDQLRAFMAEEGRLPYMSELGMRGRGLRDPRLPFFSNIIRFFGSSAAVWEALGVTPRSTGEPGHRGPRKRSDPSIRQARLVSLARDFHATHGRLPYHTEMEHVGTIGLGHSSVICSFGSYRAFWDAVGLGHPQRGGPKKTLDRG